jgi:hypothetical protein
MKTCNKCKEEKENSEFHKRGKGLRSDCKVCRSKEQKEYYYKDHEKTKERLRLSWHNNKGKYLKQKRDIVFLKH